VAFGLALLLTPLVRRLASRWGAIDGGAPFGKLHHGNVARLGGLAIACGFFAALLLVAPSPSAAEQPFAAVIFGGLGMLALGMYDDLHRTNATTKLAVQIPIAVFAWWGGARVGIGSPAASLAVTVLWIVGATNAWNLIDGLDGLASGLGFEVLAVGALCAFWQDQPWLAFTLICLCGALAGFWIHNRHPARIFMGDAGSMLLGYVVAVAAIWSSQRAATVPQSLLPAVALGLPLLDTTLAIGRRLLARRRVLTGDLDHVHHRVLARVRSHRRAVRLLYGVGLVFAALSATRALDSGPRLAWLAIALALGLALGLSLWLGYLTSRRVAGVAHEEAQPLRRRA
jgi:UDP-GlcNAc:undecaprenyl-phosphate GlcNAc-1-phosphate transferase